MVWNAVLDGLVGLLELVLGPLFAAVPAVPGWLTDAGLDDMIEQTAAVSAWLPVGHALNVASMVVACYLTSGAIGVSRSMLSHVTGGGGAS